MSDLEVAPTANVTRPQPVITERTRGFWDGARNHELRLQACRECARLHHPPVGICPECHATEFEYRAVNGSGIVHQFCVARRPRYPGFDAALPYICVAVEIDEQPGLMVLGNLLDAAADDVQVGLRVEVCFEPLGDDFYLPQFRRERGAR